MMNKRIKSAAVLLAVIGMAASGTAMGKERGDWLVRFGGSYVNPDSSNHPVVSVDGAYSLTFNGTYMMSDHFAVELLAATPFKHDINLVSDGSRVGSTKHLPPTLSLQYHFVPANRFSPYVGISANYTTFFSEKTTGALEGTDLDLKSSTGLGAQLGADFFFNDNWFMNVDLRYIDIETDARLDGVNIGTVKIDPWVYGLHVGYKF